MKINTNISALRANFNLNSVQSQLTASTNKLSSGYRITKAADDAAGMAISQKMHAQIRGLQRASKNGSDGVSFIQTTEGVLSEIENMLQRCRELSVQAANGSVTTIEDKQALQNEIDSLMAEIDRLSKDTEYNTMSVLDGSCCRQSSSNNVGVKLIDASDDVALTGYKFKIVSEATQATAKTGALGFAPTDVVDKATAGQIQINGEVIDIKEGQTFEDVYANIRDYCEMMNVDVVPVNAAGVECELAAATNLSFTSVIYGASQKLNITTDNANLAQKLGINVYPDNATIKDVVWKSANESIAVVDEDGEVFAISSGKVKITATSQDGNNIKGICWVYVTPRVNISSLRINSKEIYMLTGRTRQLSVIVRPAVNNDSYEWYSSDTGIVTVDGNGVITTVGPGEAEVYVISDGAGVESSCIVHSLAISRSNITLEQYDRYTLDVIGTDSKITWRSSNPRVCTVSSSGEVIGRKAGIATITAVVNNKTLSCTVRVTSIR